MNKEYINSKDQGIFNLSDFSCSKINEVVNKKETYRIIWVRNGQVRFIVDAIEYLLEKDQMIFLTPLNKVEILFESDQVVSFSFNREFYCISDHDNEVSCHGHLFFGSSQVPIISLNEKERSSFDMLFEVFKEEFNEDDAIQGEMLRILLKRLLIKSARLARENMIDPLLDQHQLNIIREFNVLVEMNFREKHQVKDYADMLFKSPKTLSNLFAKYNDQSPLEIIKSRIILEAKRLLLYSEKNIEEIAFELGYNEAPHFSKFFKSQVKQSPKSFRKTTFS